MINPFSDLGKETQSPFWDRRIRIWIFPKKLRTLSDTVGISAQFNYKFTAKRVLTCPSIFLAGLLMGKKFNLFSLSLVFIDHIWSQQVYQLIT